MLPRILVLAERLALALWIGGLVGFAFLFAPVAFATIPDLATFARLIGRELLALARFGYVCGAVALIALGWRARIAPVRGTMIRAALVLAMLVLVAIETRIVVPQMGRLLSAIDAPLGTLARTDSRRAAYDAEHRRSSTIYGAVLVLGLLAFAAAGSERPPVRRRFG
ncbi:MAG: DUF4149 domain-containing protein [Vulcanimicrobiaceae bacterium]